MLDHQPIHIRDIQRAVRTRPRGREPRPQIGRRKKLRLLFALRALADKRRPHRAHPLAMDQIVHRFADKDIPRHLGPEQIVAVDRRAARRREMVETVRVVKPREGLAHREHPRRPRARPHGHDRVWRHQVRISPQVTFFERIVPERVRIVAAKPVPPVVAAAPKLRVPHQQLDLARIRRDTKIPPAHVHGPLGFRRGDLSAALPIRQMHPTVERPLEAVREMLLVAFGEPAKSHRRPVRAAVAVGVLQEEHVRHRGHEHAVAPRQHRGGRPQAVGKQRGFIENAVAPRRFQHANPPARFPFAIHAARVVGHLHHPHSSVGAKGEIDRIQHHRLGRDEFHFKSGRDLDRRQRGRRAPRLRHHQSGGRRDFLISARRRDQPSARGHQHSHA